MKMEGVYFQDSQYDSYCKFDVNDNMMVLDSLAVADEEMVMSTEEKPISDEIIEDTYERDEKDSRLLEDMGGQEESSVVKLILHGWSDEECLKILKKCKEAVSGKGKGGKVMIIDVVINEKKDDRDLTETKLLFDMLMMVVDLVVTRKERSGKELENLFLEVGFSHYKITPLLGLRSLIEVYP